MSGEGLVLIVAAMAEELAAVTERLSEVAAGRVGGPRWVRGRLVGRPVAVCATGDGPWNAERGLAALLPELQPVELRIVGIAGGLSPGLRPGDVVSGRELHDGVGGKVLRDEGGVRGDVATGTVLTSGRIVSRAEEKSCLWSEIGSPVPAVVDLESAVFARIAVEAGLPWRVFRAVSDPAEIDLPLDLESFRDEQGAVERSRVARHAALRPHLVRRLMDLRSVVKECSARLADALEADLALEEVSS